MGNPRSATEYRLDSKCQQLSQRILRNSKIKKSFRYLHTNEDTVAAAIKAGCNLELGTNVYNSSLNAMKQGKLTEHEIRENVKVCPQIVNIFSVLLQNYSIVTSGFKVISNLQDS